MRKRTTALAVIRWVLIIGVFVLLFVSVLGWAYMRAATDVMEDVNSPDGKWDALLMVRNGGGMTGFSTQVSVVSRSNRVARAIAICSPGNVFIADDDHGAIPIDLAGRMQVKVTWASEAELVIAYPLRARVFKQETQFRSLKIKYKN